MDRPLYQRLWEELSSQKAMIFLAGPRQAGKTTLALDVAKGYSDSLYFNYDQPADKKKLLDDPLFFRNFARHNTSAPLIILDEIHKHRAWKNYLKGIHDGFKAEYKFLVLGSGRLDQYQKGGDSLAGRYFLFYLWPFTLAELGGKSFPFKDFIENPLLLNDREPPSIRAAWRTLEVVGGFPEPFLSGSQTHFRRWARTYQKQLLREDIRDLTALRHIDTVDSLYMLLPDRVGSPLSMESLGRDLQVPSKTIKQWVEVLERFFLIFRISPWTRKVTRAIVKEKKTYLMNPALVSSEGARFENMIALELFRAVSNWNDWGYGDFSLHYLRNKEKEEVDFLVADGNKPLFMVECKLSDDHLPPSLLKFQSILKIPALTLVRKEGVYKRSMNQGLPLLTVSAPWWLQGLP
jgi:predicted AAA+ superfamily ATPase